MVGGLALFSVVGLAAAADGGDGEGNLTAARFCQFYWENDAFAVTEGSDEKYTNGLRFSCLKNNQIKPQAAWLVGFANWWDQKLFKKVFHRAADMDQTSGWAVGQNFYTPIDITDDAPQPEDRPWAGWLYGSLLLQLQNEFPNNDEDSPTRPVQQTFELQLGVVGPPAGAEFIQKKFHQMIEDDVPVGWDNQIHARLAVNIVYQWRKRKPLYARSIDFIPHFGGSLGNVQTFVNGGGTFRFGNRLSGFPAVNVSPSVAPDLRAGRPLTEWYFTLGADARGVAHNVFLEGVDMDRFVYDLEAGLSVRIGKWRLSYTLIRRSEEFTGAPGENSGIHDFGSLLVGVEPWRGRQKR